MERQRFCFVAGNKKLKKRLCPKAGKYGIESDLMDCDCGKSTKLCCRPWNPVSKKNCLCHFILTGLTDKAFMKPCPVSKVDKIS